MQKALERAFVILLANIENMLQCLFHHLMMTESWMLDSEIIHQQTEKQIYLQKHSMIKICSLLKAAIRQPKWQG